MLCPGYLYILNLKSREIHYVRKDKLIDTLYYCSYILYMLTYPIAVELWKNGIVDGICDRAISQWSIKMVEGELKELYYPSVPPSVYQYCNNGKYGLSLSP